MRTLSLFSGIGGLDLGLERAGFQIVAQCEREPFCRAVLAKHWPGVPCFDDVRTIDPSNVPGVECVCGGFPCQDVSVAGKGVGVDAGTRSGLWREMFRVIDAIRPAWVIAENVPALRTRGADRVLGDLERIGYTCTPLVVGAGDVGAPHRRQRVFIVAFSGRLLRGASGHDQDGRQGERGEAAGFDQRRGETGVAHAECDGRGTRGRVSGDEGGEGGGRGESEGGGELEDANSDGLRASGRTWASDADEAGEEMGHATGQGLQGRDFVPISGGQGVNRRERDDVADADPITRAEEQLPGRTGCEAARVGGPGQWPAGPGERQHHWEAPRILELSLGSPAHGLSTRLVRFANRNALRAAGNAVVPQVAEIIGRAVMAADQECRT